MPKPIENHFVIYCSPAGSTRHVARTIIASLRDLGYRPSEIDISTDSETEIKKFANRSFEQKDCLWVGSPVYAHHIVPQLTEFLEALSNSNEGYGVPFVTYGGVTSGIALHDVGSILNRKGFCLQGAAKILCRHSMMWSFDNPLGEGHPDQTDDDLIRNLVKRVEDKLKGLQMSPMDIRVLDYQSADAKNLFWPSDIRHTGKKFPPMDLKEEICTSCGICMESCPTNNISISPNLYWGDRCIFCMNCVRLCEQAAIDNPMMGTIEERLRLLADQYGEPAQSRLFF